MMNALNKQLNYYKEYSESTIELIKKTNLGRIFFKNGKPAYFEIFEDNRTALIGISKKYHLFILL